VVGVRDGGIVVKTGDASILLKELDGAPLRYRIGLRFDLKPVRMLALESRIAELEKIVSALSGESQK